MSVVPAWWKLCHESQWIVSVVPTGWKLCHQPYLIRRGSMKGDKINEKDDGNATGTEQIGTQNEAIMWQLSVGMKSTKQEMTMKCLRNNYRAREG